MCKAKIWRRYHAEDHEWSRKCVKEAIEKIDEYFSDPEREILIAGFLLFIGMSSRTFYKWRKRQCDFPEDLNNALEYADLMMEQKYERGLYSKYVTGSIFALKSRFGWQDRPDIEFVNNNNIDMSTLTDEQIDRLIKKVESDRL